MISKNPDEFVYSQKYRPQTVNEIIMPDDLKDTFNAFKQQGDLVNLLLYGAPGTGKTTLARAVLNDMDIDYIFINASKDRSIDMLRNQVSEYASSASFNGKRKFVILDEADGLTAASQDALKALMEEVSTNCGFILTANHVNKIIPPLRSRCHEVAFVVNKDDREKLIVTTIKRLIDILKSEGILTEKPDASEVKILKSLVDRYYPDLRTVLTKLQNYCVKGKLDTGLLANLTDDRYSTLTNAIKSRNFADMRTWVMENSDINFPNLLSDLYKELGKHIRPESTPSLIMILNKYDYQAYFVANRDLNALAMMTELMSDLRFQ